MKILNTEYNEYVVGFVIETDKGGVNAQFEQIFSNHPEPAFRLAIACEGDNTADHLSDEEREQILEFISNNAEMKELADEFTEAYYNGSDLPELIAPIHKWQISERARSSKTVDL